MNHDRHSIEQLGPSIKITYTNNEYIHYLENQKKLYSKIQSCQYVPQMKFFDNYIEVDYCGSSLDKMKSKNVTIDTKRRIKQQLIEFVKYIYKNSIAHRDMWVNNVCWDGNQIWVIDWEYIIEHKPKEITNHYDLTGTSAEQPEQTNGMNILSSNKRSLKSWLYPLTLELTDFKT